MNKLLSFLGFGLLGTDLGVVRSIKQSRDLCLFLGVIMGSLGEMGVKFRLLVHWKRTWDINSDLLN